MFILSVLTTIQLHFFKNRDISKKFNPWVCRLRNTMRTENYRKRL